MTATRPGSLAGKEAFARQELAACTGARANARKMAAAQEALQRADSKAGTLLQLVGLELAGVMALLATTPPAAAVTMLGMALAPTLAAVVLLLITILPRLGTPVPGTWLAAAAEARAVTSWNPASGDTSGDDAVAGEQHLRRIACRAYEKYRYLQVAVWLLITGLFPLTVAVVLIA